MERTAVPLLVNRVSHLQLLKAALCFQGCSLGPGCCLILPALLLCLQGQTRRQGSKGNTPSGRDAHHSAYVVYKWHPSTCICYATHGYAMASSKCNKPDPVLAMWRMSHGVGTLAAVSRLRPWGSSGSRAKPTHSGNGAAWVNTEQATVAKCNCFTVGRQFSGAPHHTPADCHPLHACCPPLPHS